MPPAIEGLYVAPFTDFDAALDGADVVMMLRVQNERMAGGFIPPPASSTRATASPPNGSPVPRMMRWSCIPAR